jgi:hypothetical protein
MEMKMENNETQQTILLELRLIRRTVRGILFVLACGVVIAISFVLDPEVGSIMATGSAIVVLAVVAGSIFGIGAAKVVNRMKS